MSYQSVEQSVQDGDPVELMRIAIGLETLAYTSAAKPVIHEGLEYKPAPVLSERISQTRDVNREGMKLQWPRTHSFASRMLASPPDEAVTITILRKHVTDGGFATIFKGRIIGASATNNGITTEIESIYTSIKRAGLRATYQTLCRHALYSGGCGLIKGQWATDMTVSVVSKNILTIPNAVQKPSGYYTAGIIRKGVIQKQIADHTGDTITLVDIFPGLKNGALVTLYPGCDLRYDTCLNKFNDNTDNFGGFTAIPGRNPFDTTLF